MAYEPWTSDEEAELFAMVQQEIPIPDIAGRLRRQPSAIRTRIAKLDGRSSSTPVPHAIATGASKPELPNGDTTGLDPATEPFAIAEPYFRLSQITRRISELLAPAIHAEFWLRAEIGSGTERKGVFYGELVETGHGGQQIARVDCRIWRDDLVQIRRRFASAGLDLDLKVGTAIGARCAVQFDAQYGLSLRVIEMDPAVTIGELELRRREIIQRLTRDHLLDANRRRPVGLLPMRIGVVASRTSAGYADFMKTLKASGFAFKIFVADALMQGPRTQTEVWRALDVCARLHVDLIAVIRGGGSKTDLASLDDELIARSIAGSPVAVWTGIGHDTDVSVLDYVAAQAHKTPSALAEALVQKLRAVDEQSRRVEQRLYAVWGLRFGMEMDSVGRSRVGLRQGTRKLLDITREQLGGVGSRSAGRVQVRLTSERIELSKYRAALRAAALEAIAVRQRRATATRSQLLAVSQLGIQKRREPLTIRRFQLQPDRVRRLIQQRRTTNADRRTAIHAAFVARLAAEQRGVILSSRGLGRSSTRLEFERAVVRRLHTRFQLPVYLRKVEAARTILGVKEQAVRASAPATMLARGFSLTYAADGSLVKSIVGVRTGDTLRTEVRDGFVVSDVKEARSDE